MLYPIEPTYLLRFFNMMPMFSERRVCMARCSNCGKEVAKPDESLKNHVFRVEVYTCKNCGFSFKVMK
jgi:DNA-directed RNA polymerase subunit RPC12/RpoP